MIEISYYTRLEPRPRANDLAGTLTAEVRDPLWFLARQWQMGEFTAEDAGSLAYVEYAGRTTKIPRWKLGDTETPLSSTAPLETQTLREPFAPDFATQVELFHDFADYLREEVGNATTAGQLISKFGDLDDYKIVEPPDPDEDVLNPVDAPTRRFLGVCAGRTLNGFELLNLAKTVAGGGSIPSSVTSNATDIQAIKNALARLATRVADVFGDVGESDPAAWNNRHLEYGLQVVAEDPAGTGNVTLQAHPDSDGEYDWYSFDLVGRNASASEEAPTPRSGSVMPARVRFPGMPASRFWAFEENGLAIPDILADGGDDLLKLVVADFMLIHNNDWFVLPFEQDVGSLAQIDYLLVHDVFGTVTAVLRADLKETKAGTNRWTMFSNSDLGDGDDALADFFVVPPTPGVTMELGTVLEDVRFGRDETANMAWGIEHLTTSPIGEPRTGPQRDADVNAARKDVTPPTTGSGMPLRYQIQNEVPANWVPLLPVLEAPPNPSIVLQRGKAEKAVSSTEAGAVSPLSKILKPNSSTAPYFIAEEEIPRSGLRVERVVYRSRWTDGSTHLWVQRRRKIGAGESQSGLQFDQARPNED